MKRLFPFVVLAILMFAAAPTFGQRSGFGLGVMVGDPAGLSAKLWTTGRNALDFGLGWSIYGKKGEYEDRVNFHLDYVWHKFSAISSRETLPVYYGIGGRFIGGSGTEGRLAVRGVLGLLWWPRRVPIDAFVEVAPTFQVVPSTGLGLDAALGVRFFF